MANSVDPDQTAPIGAVCSGSMLFASILNSSVLLGNYLQQSTSADNAFFSWRFKGSISVFPYSTIFKRLVVGQIYFIIPRRSRRDIVLASSVLPSVRPFRPSVRTFCLSGTISQYLLVRFDFGTNDKYHGLSISYKVHQNRPLNT